MVFWEKQELSLTFSEISSLVMDRVCDEAGQEEIAVAGFYCDFRDQDGQTAVNIIGAIPKQLIATERALGLVKGISKGEKGARQLRFATSGYGGDSEVGCYHITVGFRLY